MGAFMFWLEFDIFNPGLVFFNEKSLITKEN